MSALFARDVIFEWTPPRVASGTHNQQLTMNPLLFRGRIPLYMGTRVANGEPMRALIDKLAYNINPFLPRRAASSARFTVNSARLAA
jgi:hypothetical protein